MCFPCFFGFSDHFFGPHHFWPTPLLAQTASWPFFFFSNRFVLDPRKLWPMELLRTICCSCFVIYAMDLLASPPSPRPPCAGSPIVLCCVVSLLCCVVLCCGVGGVCVQNFRGCVQNLGAPPTLLRRTPSSDFPPSAGPPGPPKISLFPSPVPFRSFPLSGVFSWNSGGV